MTSRLDRFCVLLLLAFRLHDVLAPNSSCLADEFVYKIQRANTPLPRRNKPFANWYYSELAPDQERTA